MDVLKPPIVSIGGRCYRRNPAQVLSMQPGGRFEEEEEERFGERDEEMYDEDMYDAESTDAVSCDPLEMEQTKDGYRLVMDVPSKFFGYIIGQRGETKKRIEQDTGTHVNIPKTHTRLEEITISGRTRQGVSSAKTRIDVLVSTARQKTPFTHFVSIPLNSQPIMERFGEFKEQVLAECKHCSGVEDKIFQVPEKLHLTIITLVLLNRQEVKAAQEILEDCMENIVSPILEGSPLLIDLAGLEYMNDDPGKVDVLYGKVRMQDGSNRLQEVADRIRDRFAASDLCQDKHRNLQVKLHATLMNSRFTSGEAKGQRSEVRGRGQKPRESFDVSEILELFGDFFFAEHLIDSIHISEMGPRGDDGFYAPAAKVSLT